MRAVIGVPCGNRIVVFKLLPAFVGDLIFVRICLRCLRGIARLIVEFRIFNGSRGDGAWLHGQVIGVIIFLIFVNIQKLSESTGRIRMLTEILFCGVQIRAKLNRITGRGSESIKRCTFKMVQNRLSAPVFACNSSLGLVRGFDLVLKLCKFGLQGTNTAF